MLVEFFTRFLVLIIFFILQISISCSLTEEIEVKLFIESRDEKGDIVSDVKILVNGMEKGTTDKKGQFSGTIKTKVGKDIILRAVMGRKEWETVFKIYPKINNIKKGKADRSGFEGEIRLEEELSAIAEGPQKGEYRFIAILTTE